jgi:L-ascorbate metabolism protein UlaG (beta-lactamase superfamily)
MKITKLIHSYILIEQGGKKLLVDPGAYSWQDEKVRSTDFSGLSAVVITHNHPDHLNEDFAAAVYKASPNARWYGTQEVIDTLMTIGITGAANSEDSDIQFIESKHADLSPWFDKQPEHTSYLLFEDVLISGDCQTLTSTHGARVLAGAVNGGPWGAVVGFTKMIEQMEDKPEVIFPLHDWHWNDDARNAIYARLAEVLDKHDTKFIQPENCIEQEV